jgi:hypothetical protein
MLSELPIDLLLFILATFIGALVNGIAGFAFGLIASAILPSRRPRARH